MDYVMTRDEFVRELTRRIKIRKKREMLAKRSTKYKKRIKKKASHYRQQRAERTE